MSDYPDSFEAVEVGERFAGGDRYEVTADEIIEFAEQYDPQPFHVDREAAADSIFGGLVASGWHVCAMAMRLLVDDVLVDSGADGAVGADDLRWHEAVRPGDTLRLEGEIEEKGPWSDTHGLVHARLEVYATDDATSGADGVTSDRAETEDEDPQDDDALKMSYVGLVLWERAEPLG